jgi:hypothetical protein
VVVVESILSSSSFFPLLRDRGGCDEKKKPKKPKTKRKKKSREGFGEFGLQQVRGRKPMREVSRS